MWVSNEINAKNKEEAMEKLSTEDVIKMYYYMVLTREFEARMSTLKRDGKIDEGIHRSIGEEAVGVGATFCLRKKEDVLVPSLRSRAAFSPFTMPRASERNPASSISRKYLPVVRRG